MKGFNGKGITRRNFIGAMGIGATLALSGGAVGCAHSPNSKSSQGDSDNGVDADKRDSPTDVLQSESVETDVLVVGCGVAGLTAAICAAEEGASVLLIEQNDSLKETYGHSITAIGTTYQKDYGEDWSAQELVDFWNTYGSDGMDTKAQLFMAEHSAESIYWLIDHGVDIVGVTNAPTNPFQYPVRTFVTSADRDGVKAYLEPLKAKAEEDGVDFRFSTAATEILVENGVVVGVIAEDSKSQLTITAKSVVLCSGGFGGDSELVKKYAPLTPNSGTFEGCSTGFSMTEARKVGAELCAPGGTMAFFKNIDGGFADNPGYGMFVTREGKRFVNENLYFLDRAGLAFKQGISEYWSIYPANIFDAYAAKSADAGLKSGSIVTADSIEDLAVAMGVSVANLKDTVDKYNTYCKNGNDEEFGKPASRKGRVFGDRNGKDYDLDLIEKEYVLLNSLEEGPFYAINMTPSTVINGTNGGMKTNTNGQVIGLNGNVIPGLFAAGECASGHLIGFFYPQSGTSLLNCFCFGRYAGVSAAQNAK